jgi:hypothetical protein
VGVVVYGIVEPGTKLPRDLDGIGGLPPRRIDCRSVAALVGSVEPDALVARRRDLKAHMAVLAAALERSTVLPVQFGTVVADDEAVRAELLEPLEERFRDLLDRFENLVEMRLSSRYDEQTLLAEVVAADPAVRRLRGLPGRELQLGERVAGAYERIRAADAGRLLDAVGPLVEEEVRADGPEWDLLTSSFLLRRSRLHAFEAEVERWATACGERAACELAGPMPAYSFVDLELAEAAWA